MKNSKLIFQYKINRYIHFFSFNCLVALLISSVNVAQATSPALWVDGGDINDAPYPESQRYTNLKLTLYAKNLPTQSFIQGSLSHPYGDGPFEISHSPRIRNVSVTTSMDRITFSFTMNQTIGESYFDLITARPVTKSAYSLGRPGNTILIQNIRINHENYPFPLRWLECHVKDAEGQNLPVDCYADPILIYTDLEWPVHVQAEGFEDTVTSIDLSAIHGVNLYPPRPYSEYSLSTIFGISTFPLTFDVTLRNGKTYRITPERGTSPLWLRPPSTVLKWEQIETKTTIHDE
ncbi:MAG: hypothetical protein ACE15F_22035 [bacterium]